MRFDELNLEDAILDGLDAMNFQEATPVQEQTIPVILAKKDISGTNRHRKDCGLCIADH